MQRLRIERPKQNRVIAVFESSAAFFELPRAATLEDLAGHLAHLSERHDGALISVDVRVSSERLSLCERGNQPLRKEAPSDRSEAHEVS